jgi:hypothetical protein
MQRRAISLQFISRCPRTCVEVAKKWDTLVCGVSVAAVVTLLVAALCDAPSRASRVSVMAIVGIIAAALPLSLSLRDAFELVGRGFPQWFEIDAPTWKRFTLAAVLMAASKSIVVCLAQLLALGVMHVIGWSCGRRCT